MVLEFWQRAMTDKEPTITDDSLMHDHFCWFCGTRVVMSYVGVIFDTSGDPDSPLPKQQMLNIDGTQHYCAARQAVGRFSTN
jgi:hypothetical protein